MIDLHCHLLPRVDDGAIDVDDAVAMAAQAHADGIEAICATPHIRHDHDVRIPELAGRVEELQVELGRRDIGVRVLVGGEVAETSVNGLSDEELHTVALGDGNWILLEPAPGPLSPSLAEAQSNLSARGFRALIAHPERHAGPGWMDALAELVRSGALVQATAAYLEEGDGSPLMPLAERGLIHVLGSDSHSSRFGRPVILSRGLAGLGAAAQMRAHLEWVAREAPAAIVNGEPVEPPYPTAS